MALPTVIDLRSDTVTRPTAEMRRAIAVAEVGDDVHGDDPTVNKLEARIAETFGKDAALFVPSGTMGNLTALITLAQPGEEIILERQAHVFCYEVASVAALGGLQLNPLDGDGGVLTAEMIAPHIRVGNLHAPHTRVIAIENTHNRAGGRIFPFEEMKRVKSLAEAHGLSVHLDGARLANASEATGISFGDYAACCDTVSMCFSKGLGAPVGSVLTGSHDVIGRARRRRKQLGGAMRQAGILAAAALHGLDHHVDRLSEDHRNARKLAASIESTAGLRLVHEVETNIVIFEVDESAFTVEGFLDQLRAQDIVAGPFGPRRVRMVTHLDVSSEEITRVGEVFARLERR